MKNNLLKKILIFIFCLFTLNANSSDDFNFDVTEVQILDNGNKFIGTKRGTITTSDGVSVDADQFEYNKKLNLLNASGNVKIFDKLNGFEIYSEKILYKKNENIISTEGNSKAISQKDNFIINAFSFNYNRDLNIITAKKNVSLEDKIQDYKIISDFISYSKNEEKFFSDGKTTAIVDSKYNFKSSNVTFLKNSLEIFSNESTTVTDNSDLYKLKKFHYNMKIEELKGEEILIQSNYNLPDSDKFYFSSALINLKNKSFISKDPEIKIHKNIFDNSENDPRIIGVSATGNVKKTIINKASFTSCKNNQNCTPWSINAREIIHDKEKSEIIYNNAVLNIYDVPILYFPKFFHPDPSVDRRSGFLQPQFNNSNILGSSFGIPYYSVIDESKDFTFTPIIFDKNIQMMQNEYRAHGANSKFYANFNFVNNYKSSLDTAKNSIFSFFSKYDLDLNLENFISSDIFLSIEKITNDTFLKIFDTNIQNNNLKPRDFDNLKSELKISLKHENYNLETGIQSYENLQKASSDRYEYVFPYYIFDKTLSNEFFDGSLNFSSSGENILNDTNVLKSSIINDIIFESKDYISFNSFKTSFGVDIKNLNSLGKNHSQYKSSPQIEMMSIFNFDTSIPLLKKGENYTNYLIPKLSLKVNPSDMKDYFNSDRVVDVNNIFANNRLGINDSLEAGKSITLGLDFKKENIEDPNKFFELKLASVLRDKEENFIPKQTTLNKKSSNIFGSVSNNFIEFLDINYNFAIDNNLKSLEYSNFNAELKFNNLTTQLNFVEESGEMGSANFIENDTSFKFNENNYLTFKTRRNKKLNLTEYYDLVYEYKNDCLTAGIKYKKTYYEDRDLKPSENIFFTISLIPLTNYEQKIER